MEVDMTLDEQSQGPSMDLSKDTQELTIEDAAALLFVSQGHVRKLLSAGELNGVHVFADSEVRINRDAILALKERMRAEQKDGLAAMIEASERIGLYDTDAEGLPTRLNK
jgi:excisionase family DNA binding protein